MKNKKNSLYEIDDSTPKKSDEHVLHLKNQVDKNFDENYKFVEKNPVKKFLKNSFFVFAICIVNVINFFMHGLVIKNRKYIKDLHKQKTGYISVSNHNLVLDCYASIKANLWKLPYLPTVEETLRIPGIRILLTCFKVIPIPTNAKGLMKFHQVVGDELQKGNVIHLYPEGALWPYYKELRPFKPGAFRFAVENNVPIIPFCIYFRPRKGLWKLLGKQPLVTLEILEPIYPDKTLAKKPAINTLMNECHDRMKVVIDEHFMATTNKEQQKQNEMKEMIADIEKEITGQNN